jgi:hypothetical protein
MVSSRRPTQAHSRLRLMPIEEALPSSCSADLIQLSQENEQFAALVAYEGIEALALLFHVSRISCNGRALRICGFTVAATANRKRPIDITTVVGTVPIN